MLFKNISILDENFEIKDNMFVATEGEFITYIGNSFPAEIDYGEIFNGEGTLLMSGFYNSHVHSPMSLMRGYGEGLQLHEWLYKRIFPFEATLTEEDVYWGAMLSMAESMRFGIVSGNDMYFLTDGLAKAVIESGMKANICRSVSNTTGLSPHNDPTYKEMVYSDKTYNGSGEGRVLVDASLHAEYTNDEPTIRAVANYAADNNLNIHVHLAETKREVLECKKRYKGLGPVELFNINGVFDAPTIAAHCIFVDDKDRRIFKEKGVTVASCPVSNLKLASGICDVCKLYDEGIIVTIGTDGVSSNNSLNFFEEMKIFGLLGKFKSMNPARMKPIEVLRSATINGAIAQGREKCGSLKVGNRADLIALDISCPNMNPKNDLICNIVYAASGNDVRLTMVDGKVLYKDHEYYTLDIEKIKFEVEERSSFKNINK